MSSNPKFRQGFLRNATPPAWLTRLFINMWPPFIGAGIHVEYISADFREATVRMRQCLLNTNIFGTHFGGSLFAMTDPFFALLILRNIGKDHVVWDSTSHIDFKLPARGTVRARFFIDDAILADIHRQIAEGEKYEPHYAVDVTDAQGNVVASVSKTLYIRRKPMTEERTELQ
ncbi:MAG: tetrameric acyl-CoA thioesterase [Rhodocyclales bacterium]|nr:tetrameric acyl-CoA thioesterase [Rhodocyclales bacterium]